MKSDSECADDVCARVVCRLCDGSSEVELVCRERQVTVMRFKWCVAMDRDRRNCVAYEPVTMMMLNLVYHERQVTVIRLKWCVAMDRNRQNGVAY